MLNFTTFSTSLYRLEPDLLLMYTVGLYFPVIAKSLISYAYVFFITHMFFCSLLVTLVYLIMVCFGNNILVFYYNFTHLKFIPAMVYLVCDIILYVKWPLNAYVIKEDTGFLFFNDPSGVLNNIDVIFKFDESYFYCVIIWLLHRFFHLSLYVLFLETAEIQIKGAFWKQRVNKVKNLLNYARVFPGLGECFFALKEINFFLNLCKNIIRKIKLSVK